MLVRSRPVRHDRCAVAVGEPDPVRRSGGQTVKVTVTLTATPADGVTQPGTYTAQLLVNAEHPADHQPDRRHHERDASEGLGQDAGTVTGTDCKNVTNGLNAVVFADGKTGFSWTAKSDKNGNYAFWAPKDTYTLIATASGWRPQTKTAKVQQAKTTTVNFNLLPANGC